MSLPADGTGTTPAGEADGPDAPEPRRTAADPRWFRPALAATTVLAFLGRWWYLVASKVDQVPTYQQGDAFWYSTIAGNLARGHLFENAFSGLPTADHPPLTVLVLGPASWLFDGSTFAQRMTMVVLGAATVAIVGLAGRRLAGPVAGVAAAVVAALNPSLWVNDALIMSETLTALVVALVLWVGIALARRPTTRLAVVAGVLCGLAALSRAETGLFLPLMVWPLLGLARHLDRRARLRLGVLATVGTVAVLAPWFVLNLTRFDEPVAISTNDGLTLAGANCGATYHGAIKGGWTIEPCVTDAYRHVDAAKPGAAPKVLPGVDPNRPCADTLQHRLPCWDSAQVSKVLRQQGTAYLADHTGDLPSVVVARNARVWGAYRLDQSVGIGAFEGRPRWVGRLGFEVTWLLLPVSAVGVVALRRRRRQLVPFAASLVLVVLVTTAFYGLVRFRLPWDVASCLLAGAAVALAVERLRRSGPDPARSGSGSR